MKFLTVLLLIFSCLLQAKTLDGPFRVRVLKQLVAKDKVTFEIRESEHFIHTYLIYIYNDGELIGEYNPKAFNPNSNDNALKGAWSRMFNSDQLARDFVILMRGDEIDFDAYQFELYEKPNPTTKNYNINMVNLIKLDH